MSAAAVIAMVRMIERCSVLCVAQVKAGTVSVGSEVVCKVDYERRANVAPNHTMTHVLNFALRKVECLNVTAMKNIIVFSSAGKNVILSF